MILGLWQWLRSSQYDGSSPWRPAQAIVTAAVLLGVAFIGPPLVSIRAQGRGTSAEQVVDIAQGTFIAAMVWLAAGAFGGERRKVLSLRPAPNGAQDHIPTISIAVSLMFVAAFGARSFLGPSAVYSWGTPSIGSTFLQALLLLLVAPVAEEFLFRGFLLSALYKTRWGFWGASCILSGAWAVLHFSYPLHAQVTLFLLGLTLSWSIWRTGSLWTSIVIHSLFNSYYVLLAMAQFVMVSSRI